MRRLRIPLVGMMAGIAYVAVGLVALTSFSDLWLSVVVTLTLTVLILAVVGAIAAPRPERLFWAGFAVSGWIYWLTLCLPDLQPAIGTKLASTELLLFLCAILRPETFLGTPGPWVHMISNYRDKVGMFLLIGHSLVSIGVGCLGGGVAVRLAGPDGNRAGYAPSAHPPVSS